MKRQVVLLVSLKISAVIKISKTYDTERKFVMLVNYIHWNFVSQAIRTTTREMRKLYNEWEDEEVEDEKTEKKIRLMITFFLLLIVC